MPTRVAASLSLLLIFAVGAFAQDSGETTLPYIDDVLNTKALAQRPAYLKVGPEYEIWLEVDEQGKIFDIYLAKQESSEKIQATRQRVEHLGLRGFNPFDFRLVDPTVPREIVDDMQGNAKSQYGLYGDTTRSLCVHCLSGIATHSLDRVFEDNRDTAIENNPMVQLYADALPEYSQEFASSLHLLKAVRFKQGREFLAVRPDSFLHRYAIDAPPLLYTTDELVSDPEGGTVFRSVFGAAKSATVRIAFSVNIVQGVDFPVGTAKKSDLVLHMELTDQVDIADANKPLTLKRINELLGPGLSIVF